MRYEAAFLGLAGIILGIGIIIKEHGFLIALIPILIGIALIFFSKDEEKIEQRKDIKLKKLKKLKR